MIGFETIGNATIIVFDGAPVLATDPWIKGSAYFGSWGLSHEVPAAQLESIRRCPFLWFSHGHPDHLNADSLGELGGKTILLPDHAGGRIYADLTAQGLKVEILPSRQWHSLSPHLRVMCIPDFNQDAVLLVDIKGVLLINTNDAIDHGWQRLVQRVARDYKVKFLLKLSGYYDADMINMFSESGDRIPPRAALKIPPGIETAAFARLYGATHIVPFSSFHRYQREDSVWADEFTTPLAAYADGFAAAGTEFLPAFIRYDVERDEISAIEPAVLDRTVFSAADFGDDWSEQLTGEDVVALRRYFQRKQVLRQRIGFIRLRVGGRDSIIDMNPKKQRIGITFEVPRNSLMTAVRYEVFDDLLIGNFMRTTLHGMAGLYPDFSPFVAKYADNGRANTKVELARYFIADALRAPTDILRFHFWEHSEALFRRALDPDTRLFAGAKCIYHFLKRP